MYGFIVFCAVFRDIVHRFVAIEIMHGFIVLSDVFGFGDMVQCFVAIEMIDGFVVLCAVFWDKVHAFYAVSTNISGAVDLFVSGVFRDLLGTLVRL